ncbi:MAG: type II toxin-antitoxin system HicA family toxin [Parcubacteria group bacterium]|nr:type II toxin-antitoxin system HicA family toxin [Parcubacteria group bacterium]
MPKLPHITPKKLLNILKKNGFQVDHTTGSHFVLYNPETKRRAIVAHHNKDLPQGTLMSILSEAGITRKEFLELLKK